MSLFLLFLSLVPPHPSPTLNTDSSIIECKSPGFVGIRVLLGPYESPVFVGTCISLGPYSPIL